MRCLIYVVFLLFCVSSVRLLKKVGVFMFEVDKIEYNFCFLCFGYILCSIKVIMFCCCLNRLMNVVVLVLCISVVFLMKKLVLHLSIHQV